MKATGFSDVIDLLGHGHGRIEINFQAFYIRKYIQTANYPIGDGERDDENRV